MVLEVGIHDDVPVILKEGEAGVGGYVGVDVVFAVFVGGYTVNVNEPVDVDNGAVNDGRWEMLCRGLGHDVDSTLQGAGCG